MKDITTQTNKGTMRVRFAPSPTGHLHIGGVRTALFNWLFARQTGGTYFLRIEDTDQERSEKRFEEEIIDSFRWLGLTWDGALVRQSERLGLYAHYAEELMKQGCAYRVDTTTPAVKFKMPKEQVVFDDLVHGPIAFDTAQFDDLVIIKSDGFPTWTFACIVDDGDMGITHVVRGDDHISNTPRQIVLARALGMTPPRYGHLPLIFGADGTPLSKRHGATALYSYREQGYVPDGILNYLALLGWGPRDNKEFFTLHDLLEHFSFERVNNTNAVFDPLKLNHINGLHLKALPLSDFCRSARAYVRQYHPEAADVPDAKLDELFTLFRERISCCGDIFREAGFFFDQTVTIDPVAREKHLSEPSVPGRMAALIEMLGTVDFSDLAALESNVRTCAERLGVKAGQVIHPMRVALTGKSVSPGIFDVMKLLGKDVVVTRLKAIGT